MTLTASDWTIDRSNGNIRYIGDDHVRFGGSTPSYATTIEFHRWLQDLADDAVADPASSDELDITNTNPSSRSTDNIITLINGYNIDDNAAEHIYDGSIIQNDGDDIYDGFVNYGNSDILIQIIQNGAVLTDDWWNTTTGGLNANAAKGISHRFMLKTRSGGADIDNKNLIGICRRWGYSYKEFKVTEAIRGNNTLALDDVDDINNDTAVTTVATWTSITNLSVGYNGQDVNNDSTTEYYYSEWDLGTNTMAEAYERWKYLTRDGSTDVIYGLTGEIFRGITHEIDYTGLTGTFDEAYSISYSGSATGTAQVLADDGSGTLWVQRLTGDVPVSGVAIAQTSPDSATATAQTVTAVTLSFPMCGSYTGSNILGSFGFGIQTADLVAGDSVIALDGATYLPPNNVQNTVGGLVPGEDRVLVGPWDGSSYDTNGDPEFNYDQFNLATALTVANVTQVAITTGDEGPSIPSDTPSSGYIRVTDNDGLQRRLHYSSWSGSIFTIDTTDGNEDFDVTGAAVNNDVWIAYIDELASGTTASYTSVQSGTRQLVVLVRDGGGTPIKQFISEWSQTSSPQTITAIRTSDE